MMMAHSGNGKGLIGLYELNSGTVFPVDFDLRAAIADEVIDQANREFPVAVLQSPSEADRQRIQERIDALVSQALRRQHAHTNPQLERDLALELGRRLLGLGFLDLLLPPARTDLSEICIYSNGLVQVMRKNNVRWETLPDLKPDPGEINRVLDRLLGPQNKSLNEANPSVNAKLPATAHNPGGGRIKALHPVISPPGRNPSVNIRLFEQKPVLPEWILAREMMNPEMMALLQTAMEQGYRILITGGTRTGKTTLLSALCNFLPSAWRIVKIEDPEEIWIDRPTVQTIEARPAAVGTEIRSYTLANGVDDALRMSPDYLILGEVRDGHAAMSLFRAMMTGHAGSCTFHADSPREAVRRLATVMGADAGVRPLEAYQSIADAIDLLVQIGIRNEIRRVTVIASTARELRAGEIVFEPLYRFDDRTPLATPRWEKVGELRPRIVAETSL
jgi:pilus assembly protein CpaF